MKKRMLSLLLAVLMVLSTLPVNVLAADAEETEESASYAEPLDEFIEDEPAATVEDEPAATVEDEPAATVEDEPTAPGGDEPAAPVEDEPAAPGGNEPAATVEDEPAAPGGDEPAAPGGDEPAAPVEDEPAAPSENEPEAPAEDEPEKPAEDEPEEPAEDEPMRGPGDGETRDPAQNRLASLTFRSGSGTSAAEYALEPAFDPAVDEYTLALPDNAMSAYVWASLAEGASGVICAVYAKYGDGDTQTQTIASGASNGTMLNYLGRSNSLTPNTLNITVGDETAYVIHVVRRATLAASSGLTVAADGAERPLTPAYSRSTFAYTACAPADAALMVTAQSTVSGAVLKINGATAANSVPLSVTPVWASDRTAELTVEVGSEGAVSSVYTVTLIEQPTAVTITRPASKLAYAPGEIFDPEGMELTVTYADGTTEPLSVSECVIDPAGPLTLADTVVRVIYKEAAAEQPITFTTPFDGAGTDASPYLIRSGEDMQALDELVEGGETFADTYIKLAADITLPEGFDGVGESAATGESPSNANSRPFSGDFDGGGNQITIPEGGTAIFNFVRGAVIHDLDVYGARIADSALVSNYIQDDNVSSVVVFENVTLKSGTQTLKSGFIGGYARGTNAITIRGCTVESGVVIGYNGDQDNIGSFAGEFNGTITNCSSGAAVYGNNFVGGIVADKGQSVAAFTVTGCTFSGSVTAAGNYAGGIVGAGYGGTHWGMLSAWSCPGVTITGCTVTASASVSGAAGVGGILGGEGAQAQAWSNGPTNITGNSFSGRLSGTRFVGGVVGYIIGINKYTNISGNTFTGADRWVGGVGAVDTSGHEPGFFDGVYYYNTSTAGGRTETEIQDAEAGHELQSWITVSTLGSAGYKTQFKVDHNRTDDPLGPPPAEVLAQGDVGAEGSNVTWKVTADGVLTIGGTGAMRDTSANNGGVPWRNYLNVITAIVVEEGVTSINRMHTEWEWNTLTSVTLPESLVTIDHSFHMNNGLKSIRIPAGVRTIDYGFNDCHKLEQIELYAGVQTITAGSFNGCSALTRVLYHGTENQFRAINIEDRGASNMYFWLAEREFIVDDPTVLVRIAAVGEYKTRYALGEEFSTEGMTVLACYGGGAEPVDVTDEVRFEGFDSSVPAVISVTMTYGEGEDAVSTQLELMILNSDGTLPIAVKRPLGGVQHYRQGDEAGKIGVVECLYNNVTYNYQWYSNTVPSEENATKLTGERYSVYTPVLDTVGTFYYFCIVTREDAEGNRYSINPGYRRIVVDPPAIPTADCSHGFVENIAFLNGGGPQVPLMDFDPAVASYDVELLGCSNRPGLDVELTAAAAASGETFFMRMTVDGVRTITQTANLAENTNDKMFSGTRPADGLINCKTLLCSHKAFGVDDGTPRLLSVIVGTKYDSDEDGTLGAGDDFLEYDVYNFNVTYLPNIHSLSLSDYAAQLTLTPAFEAGYFYRSTDTYYARSRTEYVRMQISMWGRRGYRLFIGDTEYLYPVPDNETTFPSVTAELDLNDFEKDESGAAHVPIRVTRLMADGSETETVWHIYITQSDQYPEITAQPVPATVEKGESVTLSVSAQASGDGVLSYQWYAGQSSYSRRPIEGATQSSYEVPATDTAGKRWYSCVVTNTVDGTEYVTQSEFVSVTTNLTYVKAPGILTQPWIYTTDERKPTDPPYRTSYYAGNSFDPVYYDLYDEEPGTALQVDFYYSAEPAAENAVPVEGRLDRLGAAFDENNLPGSEYSFTPSTGLPAGDWYAFFVVTATALEDPTMTAVTVSDMAQLHVDPSPYGFEGSGLPGDPYLLQSAEDFIALQRGTNEDGESFTGVWFRITADISLPGDWESIGKGVPFAGRIDGAKPEGQSGNWTIFYAPDSEPLFDQVGGVTIKNLNIFGERINGCGLIDSQLSVKYVTVRLENITLLSGSSTLRSGLLQGGFSSMQAIKLVNCTVQAGVTIGYGHNQGGIGSFLGGMVGSCTNCVSYADVYGSSRVGGIAGYNANSMGHCDFYNCTFGGAVHGVKNVGGILGQGLEEGSAPNTRLAQITGCTVTGSVEGVTNVGGIYGSEGGLQFTYDAVSCGIIRSNVFSGTVSGSENVGALVGLYSHLDKYVYIENNYYDPGCGAARAIGRV